MFKISVLVSGSGSNLAQLIKSKISINCVISDRKCKALDIAKHNDIDFFIIDKKEFSEKIITILKDRDIDLVVLAGFLSILDKKVINNFQIINIHPSLLPKYGGKNMYGIHVHQQVLENNEIYSGCTVHYVDTGIDTGEIIAQKQVNISEAKTPDEVQKLVMQQEWKLLPEVVHNFIDNNYIKKKNYEKSINFCL